MHKCLFVKSDNCDFNWWNSCLCLDAMFGYMNLKIIKLLMSNFICLYIHVYLCFTQNWWRMNCCWWIVDEFIFEWCCCCYEVLLLMIHTLGVHNYGFVVWIELLLRVLYKLVELMNCVEMIFDFMFDVFLSTWTCKQSLETYLGVGKSKLEILGEKG